MSGKNALVTITVTGTGSYMTAVCAVCGGSSNGHHQCLQPVPYRIVQTPWGTWEKRLG